VVDVVTLTEFSPQGLRSSPVKMNSTNFHKPSFITEANT